ncbi:hypothetical protein MNV49_006919 [Pseudohyphozyma bogoriensis]|nr:hypothetical protein MNV49_006919 [Pseudohyphozyma bogoriensis]
MLGHRGSNSHKRRLDNTPKLERRCTLYTSPTSTSTLPVFEQLDITWDPSCLSISSSEIDLYLNVQSTAGLQAVHEWTGVTYSAGKLSTQLNPGWWNASTGAGTVSAQFIITPSGSPIWDTSAPSGPSFSISYNGSYPSATASAVSPSYTGPSVESVSTPSTSVSGGKLGAAIAVPLLAVIAALGAYIAWNKWRKKPEKKRWSAVRTTTLL